MAYKQTIGGRTYQFGGLKDLMAKATPARSGDYLAGILRRTTRNASPHR